MRSASGSALPRSRHADDWGFADGLATEAGSGRVRTARSAFERHANSGCDDCVCRRIARGDAPEIRHVTTARHASQ
jgi:hypothetical protein